jgi:hypothetical protein
LTEISSPVPRQLKSVLQKNVQLVVQLHSSVFMRAMQMDAESEVSARLAQLAAEEATALKALRQHIEAGVFATHWSKDEAWLTIVWRPQEVPTDADG